MKTKLFVFAILFSASIFAQDKQWTLQECVTYALENNLTVKQAENALLSNEQDIIATKSAFLPSVGANLSQNLSLGTRDITNGQGVFVDRISRNTGIQLNASETIFNGFRNKNLHKQSKLNLETNKLELGRIKDNISISVFNSYLNVLFNKENLEIAKKQYAFTTIQLKQVEELVEAGVQPRANIYDIEATLSSDVQKITVAENNLDLAKLTLSQLLQVPFKDFDVTIIELEAPSDAMLYEDVTPILDYALQNRNEMKIAEKDIENAKLNTEISKSGYFPTITLRYGFDTNAFFSSQSISNPFFTQLDGNSGNSLNLGVNIPIFSRNQNKTAVAKSKIREENSKLNLEKTKLNLEANIQRAFTDAKGAFRSYDAAKSSLKAQDVSFKNSEERFKIGTMNAFDLEQSKIRLRNAESALVNAKYDFIFKTKVLDYYLGKIDVSK